MLYKRFLLFVFSLSILFVGLPNALSANRAHEGLPPLMKLLDIDKDGVLSPKEINAAAQILKRLDTNKDGFVNSNEVLNAGVPEENRRLYRYLKKHDKNRDGKLSRSELGENSADMFGKIDKNQDGFLTKAEILHAIDSTTNKPVGAIDTEDE